MDPYILLKKYYNESEKLYQILIHHSELVKNKALQVAEKHPELQLDVKFIAEAAMLHDIGIFKCFAPKIHCFGHYKYIEHGYLGAEILRAEGFPKHADVCERHTGVGLSVGIIIARQLPIPHRDYIPVTMEEKVICYADKFYSKSKPDRELDLNHIRKSLAKHGDENVVKFDRWHERFK